MQSKSNKGAPDSLRAPATPSAKSTASSDSDRTLRSASIDIEKQFEKAKEKAPQEQRDTGKGNEGIYVTKEDLKQIITDAVESALASFMNMVKGEVRAATREDFDKVDSRIHDVEVEGDRQAKVISETQERVERSEWNSGSALHKARQLDHDMLLLRNELNEVEQYSRRAHIRIHGLEETEGETTVQLQQAVEKLIRDGYKVPLMKDDVEVCHRIGRRGAKPRQVIVRFLRRGTKERLFTNLKLFRKRNIRVFHDLTHANSRLLYDAKNHPRIEAAWASYTGHIVVKGVNGAVFKVDLLTNIDSELNKQNV